MNYSGQFQKEDQPIQSTIGQEIIERFEKNILWATDSINLIEDKCHKILNLRTPEVEEKDPTPMENDLCQSLKNRVTTLEKLNNRLEKIVKHLDRIVP